MVIIDGKITAHRHEYVGAKMARKILTRFSVSEEDSEYIVSLVADHMRIKKADEMRLSKIMKLIEQANFDDLLVLAVADSMSSVSRDEVKNASKLDFVHRLKAIQAGQ